MEKGEFMRKDLKPFLAAVFLIFMTAVPVLAQQSGEMLQPPGETAEMDEPVAEEGEGTETGIAEIADIAAVEEIVPEVSLPGDILVEDYPNDAGGYLNVSFSASEDELVAGITMYRVYRRPVPDFEEGDWIAVRDILVDELEIYSFVDGRDPDYLLESGVQHEYRVAVVLADKTEVIGEAVSAQEVATGELFHTDKVIILVAVVFFIVLLLFYFARAKTGADLYLRPIPGIDAIDEAIGRATEMGKPILYVPGISTIEDVATIASLTILSRVAKKVAEYQTPLLVPNRMPVVYTVAEECVKQAYLEAGRADAYDPDSVFFVTTSQFAYVAAVNGLMIREKPATNFYLGMFYAESLLLAETGSLSGAIQIAGTDAVVQLPFFITTCDYTLIGEELYAASAYLGREPKQVGGVKGQDACKGILMFFITAGVLAGLIDTVFNTGILNRLVSLVSVPPVS